MIQKIKTHLLAVSASILLLVPVVVPAATALAAADIGGSLCQGTTISINGTTSCNQYGSTNNLDKFLQWAVNLFSAVVGVIAVVMIILGGLKYITSGGDSAKVGSAKNTLLFAIVGLIIVALAQVIVHFVIGKAQNTLGNGL